MYNDSIQEVTVNSQMGGTHDDDWCAPSVSHSTFGDEDEEVLVEKDDDGIAAKLKDGDTDSVFRADKNSTDIEEKTLNSPPTSSKVDEYADMLNYEDDSLALDDTCVAAGVADASAMSGDADGGIVLARRYDVSITYGMLPPSPLSPSPHLPPPLSPCLQTIIGELLECFCLAMMRQAPPCLQKR